MSVFRKILLAILFVVVALISSWLRFGDLDAARRWWANHSGPSAPASVAHPPSEEVLAFHQTFLGTLASGRDGVMVLHFRRADGAEDLMAQGVVEIVDGDGVVRKSLSAWSGFRKETPAGASMSRITVGLLPPGTYRVTVDLGSRSSLGVKRAAIELSSSDADPVWADLVKAK